MLHHVYGTQSQTHLSTCHPLLQSVAHLALRHSPVDIAIVWGWRGREVQNSFFEMGTSKVRWPDSKHNYQDSMLNPYSLALDFGPYIPGHRIPWKDERLFSLVAGVFFAAFEESKSNGHLNAHQEVEALRWGGDWDCDGLTTDQTFLDLGHIELVLKKAA
jgi:peptidoglycan L-alanyl-D-glutamate endopeptidase CwlK